MLELKGTIPNSAFEYFQQNANGSCVADFVQMNGIPESDMAKFQSVAIVPRPSTVFSILFCEIGEPEIRVIAGLGTFQSIWHEGACSDEVILKALVENGCEVSDYRTGNRLGQNEVQYLNQVNGLRRIDIHSLTPEGAHSFAPFGAPRKFLHLAKLDQATCLEMQKWPKGILQGLTISESTAPKEMIDLFSFLNSKASLQVKSYTDP